MLHDPQNDNPARDAKLRGSVRVADVQHSPSIPLHADRFVHRVPKNRVAAAIVIQVRDPADVVLCFPELRNTGTARYGPRASVISSQTELNIAAVIVQ